MEEHVLRRETVYFIFVKLPISSEGNYRKLWLCSVLKYDMLSYLKYYIHLI